MSDRARRSSGIETKKANCCADRKCQCGATSEIAARVSAKRQAADSQSDESHGVAEDRSGDPALLRGIRSPAHSDGECRVPQNTIAPSCLRSSHLWRWETAPDGANSALP